MRFGTGGMGGLFGLMLGRILVGMRAVERGPAWPGVKGGGGLFFYLFEWRVVVSLCLGVCTGEDVMGFGLLLSFFVLRVMR